LSTLESYIYHIGNRLDDVGKDYKNDLGLIKSIPTFYEAKEKNKLFSLFIDQDLSLYIKKICKMKKFFS
jgi:hypothetical protein